MTTSRIRFVALVGGMVAAMVLGALLWSDDVRTEDDDLLLDEPMGALGETDNLASDAGGTHSQAVAPRGLTSEDSSEPLRGASALLTERITIASASMGTQLLHVIERYVPVDFSSPQVRSSFINTKFFFEAADNKASLLGVDLLREVQEQGYELEPRDNRIWIREVPNAE